MRRTSAVGPPWLRHRHGPVDSSCPKPPTADETPTRRTAETCTSEHADRRGSPKALIAYPNAYTLRPAMFAVRTSSSLSSVCGAGRPCRRPDDAPTAARRAPATGSHAPWTRASGRPANRRATAARPAGTDQPPLLAAAERGFRDCSAMRRRTRAPRSRCGEGPELAGLRLRTRACACAGRRTERSGALQPECVGVSCSQALRPQLTAPCPLVASREDRVRLCGLEHAGRSGRRTGGQRGGCATLPARRGGAVQHGRVEDRQVRVDCTPKARESASLRRGCATPRRRIGLESRAAVWLGACVRACGVGRVAAHQGL